MLFLTMISLKESITQNKQPSNLTGKTMDDTRVSTNLHGKEVKLECSYADSIMQPTNLCHQTDTDK